MPTDEELREIAEVEQQLRELNKALGGTGTLHERAPDEPPLCSFCGIGRNYVSGMFAGKHQGTGEPIYVCSECIRIANEMLAKTP